MGGVDFDIGPVEIELIIAVVYILFGVYGYQNMELPIGDFLHSTLSGFLTDEVKLKHGVSAFALFL